jgi:DNA-binding transcriptional LysR family regulator
MTAAARALGVSQSTMSEVVAALERALGTRIVTRRRGGHDLALTPAGEALVPYARSVLASLDEAHVAVAAVDRNVRAGVELIANESISTYLLPPALAELRKLWPNTRFAVTVGMCPSITEGLSKGRYDVGLMLQTRQCVATNGSGAGELDVASNGHMLLGDVPLAVFSVAGHPLCSRPRRREVQRERLAAYTLFISDARGYFFDLVRDFFRTDGVPSPRLEPTGSVEAVKSSVAADPFGLGVLPVYALGEELASGRFHTLPIQPQLPAVRLEAMQYRTRPPVHPAVAALLEILRTTLGQASETYR